MAKWRLWHSTKSFCEFIVDNTVLSTVKGQIEFKQLAESDAAKSSEFHKVPDHIKKILYLDAADLIIEYNSEPILCIEVTTEAGTGHNSMQRFARIAAAVENNVPAIYIMPEAAIISREKKKDGKSIGSYYRWDAINPTIFRAFNRVMDIFKIPALFFYYPSDYKSFKDNPDYSPHLKTKGVIFDSEFTRYPGCPSRNDQEMKSLFDIINRIISHIDSGKPASSLINKKFILDRKDWIQNEYFQKLGNRPKDEISPITATKTISTHKLLNYLAKYSTKKPNQISELLSSRPQTVIYQCDSKFRADPYAGTLAAIDYMLCREGKTYEEREHNLVICFGKIIDSEESIKVESNKASINNFIRAVNNCESKNMLKAKTYSDIEPLDIGRYYMQVRYGSTYSKSKLIRVISYFADAIIFNDGALWREA